MRSDESDNSDTLCTSAIMEAANNATLNSLPVKSKERYRRAFSDFEQWQKINEINSTSENALLAYFVKLHESNKPSTLWAYYSMIKTMLNLNHQIDISTYCNLTAFLKRQSEGYRPKKTKVFTEEQMISFILEAPNREWLVTKVACIFGLCGALRTDEFVNINSADVKMYSDMFHVSINQTKNNDSKSFVVTGDFYNIVKKYKELRPSIELTNRFFVNYTNGKCTSQVIGKHKFSKMPSQIAAFLNLDEPDKYTGHAFRRKSATVEANTGATIETLPEGWKSSSVAEQYIEDSVMYKKRLINVIESAINVEAKRLKPSHSWPETSTSTELTNSITTTDDPQLAEVLEMKPYQDINFNDNQKLIIQTSNFECNDVNNFEQISSTCTSVINYKQSNGESSNPFNFNNCTVTFNCYQE